MSKPWLTALKAIPWAALLTKTPEIARAADALLSGAGTRVGKTASPNVDQLRSLTERIDALENRERANAALMKQMTDQISALTAATQVLAARQRWLLACAIASLGLAIVAIVLAW